MFLRHMQISVFYGFPVLPTIVMNRGAALTSDLKLRAYEIVDCCRLSILRHGRLVFDQIVKAGSRTDGEQRASSIPAPDIHNPVATSNSSDASTHWDCCEECCQDEYRKSVRRSRGILI